MTTKLAYCPPESEVINIQTLGILCQSNLKANVNATYNGMNQEEEVW